MEKKTETKLPVYGLSYNEYIGIRDLYGMLGIIDHNAELLQKRLKVIPNAWRDTKMIGTVLQKTLAKLVQTCPRDRRLALSKELQHVHMQVKTTKPKKHEGQLGMVTYVNQGPLQRVIDKAVELECFGCEKKGRQVCDCQLRKDVQLLYHYEFPQNWQKGCPLADRLDE